MNKHLNVWTHEQVDQMNKKNLVIEMLDMLSISPSILTSELQIQRLKQKLTLVETSMGISISRY